MNSHYNCAHCEKMIVWYNAHHVEEASLQRIKQTYQEMQSKGESSTVFISLILVIPKVLLQSYSSRCIVM